MAVGDQLDQVLSGLNAEQAQQAQRRVPAPAKPVPPVTASGQGRAAPSAPPNAGGPSITQRIMDYGAQALDRIIPGVGTAIGYASTHSPQQTLSAASGTAAGILRSPVTAAAGISDFAGDVGGAISPKADFRNYEGHVSSAGVSFRYAPQDAEKMSTFARQIDPLAQVGNQTANETSSQIASLAVGYGAGAGLSKAIGLAPKIEEIANAFGNPIARAAVTGTARLAGLSAADAVVMDPEAERFSNLLQNLGVHSEFTDWLAHKDDEGHLAGRFKNAVEGLGLGAATESLLGAGRYWKARLSGDQAGADAIQSELAAQHDGQVPDYIIEPHTGEPPKPAEPGFVGGWENAPDGTVRPVYAEDPLKGADKAVTAEAADDGVSEAGAGKPTESSAGPSAVDEPAGPRAQPLPADHQPEISSAPPQGTAPVAKPGEEPLSFTAKQTPDDPGTVVGPMDRQAIEGLSNDIRFWQGARDAEGGRAIDVTPGTDTAASHGEFRLGNIGSQASVAPTLRALLDHIPERTPRTDAELMQDTLRASNELGEDPAVLLEASRLISGKLADADTSMALIRTVWKKAESQIDGLPNTDWENAPQADVDKAAQQIYNMMAISSHVQDAKAGLGRGLRVNQLPDAESYLNSVSKADVGGPPIGDVATGPLPRTRQEVQTWLDAWQATKGDPELRADLLEGALTRSIPSPGQYLRRSFPNFFTAAVLSAPRTHFLGFTGPVLMSVLRNIERVSGGYLASLNPFISASERQANLIAARQASFNYLDTYNSAGDALHWAWKAAEENASQLHSGVTFDNTKSLGPLSPSLVQQAGYNPNDIRYTLGNAINLFPRAIGRVYNFTDELTQRLAYYGDVRSKAIVEGAQSGLSGDDLHEFVRGKVKASADMDPASAGYGEALDKDALTSASSNSFLNPVGSDGTWVRRIADGINGMRRDFPEMRYILPVFNVPANILGQMIRRSPLAYVPGFGLDQTAKALSGEMGPVAQAEAHGRMMTGAAFLTTGFLLSRAGLLTGAGPQEGTARKVWLMEHEPWSLRVGDNWVRLDKYDVAGGLLTVPATVADATQYVKQDQGVGDMIGSAVGALAEWFKDRASFRGVMPLLELGDDPTANTANVFKRTTAQVAASMVSPNIVQTLGTQQMDTILRRKQAWTDYLKAAIPGLSSSLPPVRNVLGEPVNRAADTLGEAVFPVTIAPATTFKTDPVIDELDRLYHVTGYAGGADPKALGYGAFHPSDVTLENGQTLYDAFMQARLTMPIHGRTLRQSLDHLFQSPEYNAAVDADPGQAHTSRGDASRGYMVEQVFNSYNKAIKAELAEGSPIANNWLTAASAKQRDDAYLRDVSAEDLVNNPGYYQSHGINPATYSSKVREGATGALLQSLRRH